MSVEDLIKELQKMPPNYEVKAYEDDADVGEFKSDVFEVQSYPLQKEVHLLIETGRELDEPNY